jgi:DNA modification methylase
MTLPRNEILTQNALERWAIPDDHVDCVITSPPYWGLRDYNHDGQIGMEQTPEAYVENLVKVFRQVRRILKPSGTLWLNLGDTYWGGKGQSAAAWTTENGDHYHKEAVSWAGKGETRPQDRRHAVIKPKDLVGIPWMVAFALRADGWYLRQDIIWAKPNPLPESVGDRCTKSHEHIFLLTKSRDYYYDGEAIKEPANYDGRRQITMNGSDKYKDFTGTEGKTQSMAQPGHQRWKQNEAGEYVRNRRSVWTVPTRGYPGAHFAVFPEELIVPCVKAGTSEKGNCPSCGNPWERVTEPLFKVEHDGKTETDYPENSNANRVALLRQAAREQGMEYNPARITVGWQPTCACKIDHELLRPIVFDPFGGAGTTAVVAKAHGRDYLIQELNPDYVADIHRRLRDEFGLFYNP